ncbi:MAG: hypothetical protein E5Y89_01030 [Mesorhizobium sp.]|nr:MAG: hypothetical protein E5Y89_01030 [Mesorhizobium sp.]
MTEKWTDGFRGLGKFDLPSQAGVYGELSLDGYDSKLVLHDVEHELYPGPLDLILHGVVDHTVKISLVDCIPMGSSQKSDAKGNTSKHQHTIFPHHVIFGDIHVSDTDSIFTSILLRLTDSSKLFYDFDTFGTIIDPNLVKATLATKAANRGRDVLVREHPALAYFTGKHSIIRVPTEIGTISANNFPTISLGGPTGSGFTNSIWVEIEFVRGQSFNNAIDLAFLLEPFFSTVAGRPQRFEEIRLLSRSTDGPDTDSPPF